YCTQGCMGNPDCGSDHCGPQGFCLKSCTVPGDCRAHYGCFDADGDTVKECFSVADGPGAVGAACTKDSDCSGGELGFCQTEQGLGWKGGYCTVLCVPSPSPNPTPSPVPCPGGSECLQNGALNLATSCFKNCSSKTDCRGDVPSSGYGCLGDGVGGGNIC